MLMKLNPPTPVPLRHFVMPLSKNQSAHLANISFLLIPRITLDSLPVQFKYLPSLHEGASEIQLQPLSPLLSLILHHEFILWNFCFNLTLHFSFSRTETVTVLRSLNTCNKAL